ncbi:dockerin type I repeat-containing protein [Acetivibrio cellulolyticus]|uniref:dockerin type I repeat-containing protein n=1 Tax=Acetivibrio cellulolyticus TaxID=35830 RepID=UPI0001E2D8B6|nr:dockerin type I domain-containing protein [Acetivibrio cellulolyticus]
MFKFVKLLLFVPVVLLVSQIVNVSGMGIAVFAEEGIVNDNVAIYGDVNGDNKVNSLDFAYMRQYLLGIITNFPYDNGIKAADVDGNGAFSSIDFGFMRQYLLGKIDDFPVNNQTPTITPTPTLSTQTIMPTVTPTSTAALSEFIQSKPSNLNVIISDSNSIELSWDMVEGAVAYEVLKNEVSIRTTEILKFTDSSLTEGLDYTYSIKAINDKGENSLDSDKVIVNTGEATINSNTILNENRFYKSLILDNGASLDLNGYVLDVQLNFVQINGIVNINSGRLKIGSDYSIKNDGILQMINESDYVYVGGDFTTASRYDYTDENRNKYFSAGIIEVKGSFNCINDDSFRATGSHKVILSGNAEQEVNSTYIYDEALRNSYAMFNELEIKNEAGVRFDSEISIRKMQGNYKVAGKLTLNYVETITGDVKIEGDLKLIRGVLDLSGHIFSVTGNFTQSSEVLSNTVKVNKGRLEVNGNYCVGSETETYDRYSMLQMIDEADYVYVGGNLTIMSGYNYFYELNQGKSDIEYFKAGILEVKGDFNCLHSQCFVASGSHKVILSGNSEQMVNNSYLDGGTLYNSCPVFNELEIKNETGIRFDMSIGIRKMKGNYKVIGELGLAIELPLAEDVKIEGDLKYVGSNLDLGGHNFIVTGNFTQTSGYHNSILNVNKGKLEVHGNYTINTDAKFEGYSYATLQMTNEEDYVYVGGDFTTYSMGDHSDYLTAGTLEIKGDFNQTSNPLNFAASGTHKTILSGDTVQTVTFENPETSSFNVLKLTKPIDTGYIFSTTPVWKTLEQ